MNVGQLRRGQLAVTAMQDPAFRRIVGTQVGHMLERQVGHMLEKLLVVHALAWGEFTRTDSERRL